MGWSCRCNLISEGSTGTDPQTLHVVVTENSDMAPTFAPTSSYVASTVSAALLSLITSQQALRYGRCLSQLSTTTNDAAICSMGDEPT